MSNLEFAHFGISKGKFHLNMRGPAGGGSTFPFRTTSTSETDGISTKPLTVSESFKTLLKNNIPPHFMYEAVPSAKSQICQSPSQIM